MAQPVAAVLGGNGQADESGVGEADGEVGVPPGQARSRRRAASRTRRDRRPGTPGSPSAARPARASLAHSASNSLTGQHRALVWGAADSMRAISMATVYFTASSLDGFIVDEADSLDWLTSRDIDADGPFGYEAFSEIRRRAGDGRRRPTSGSSRTSPGTWHVRAADLGADPSPAHRAPTGIRCRPSTATSPSCIHSWSQAAGYRDVWVVGGGEAAAQFVRAGLVDEMIVSLRAVHAGHRRAGAAASRSEWRWWSPASTATSSARVGGRPSESTAAGRSVGRIPLT